MLLLLLAVVGAAVWHCKQQQYDYQHGQAGAVHNPAYIVDIDAENPRSTSVVATDSNQQQFRIPMAADDTDAGAGDGDGDDISDDGGEGGADGSAPPSAEYLVAVPAKDADGYVVDDFVPDGGVGGNPIVYATYAASVCAGAGAGNGGAAGVVYSVPTSEV